LDAQAKTGLNFNTHIMKTPKQLSLRKRFLPLPPVVNLLLILLLFSVDCSLAHENNSIVFQQERIRSSRSLFQAVPRKIGYSLQSKSVSPGQTIDIEIFLLDNENRRIRASKVYKIIARIKNSTEPPGEVIISPGQDSGHYRRRSNNNGIMQIEFSHPELLSTTPFISIGSFQNKNSSNYKLVSLQPSGDVTVIAPDRVNDRVFKADGIDYAELNVYLDGTLSSDEETIKLIFSCSGCRVNPTELSLSNSNRTVTTQVTALLANVVEVRTNNVTSSVPVINDITKIKFSPAIDHFIVEIDNSSLIDLFEEGNAKITLLNKEGHRIATDTPLDVSIFNIRGKTEWEPRDGLKIDRLKREANLILWPIFPDSVEMRFSILDYNDQFIKARVDWPWSTLTFGITFGLLGGILFLILEKVINRKQVSRWRLVISLASGIFLYLVMVYFRIPQFVYKGSIHSIPLIFIICTIGGWLGPKVFEMVANYMSDSFPKPIGVNANDSR
jgi:hypothetical protein